MNRFLGWLAAVIVLALWACEKTDDLRDEIGSLSDRLAVLESRIGDVNADIVALHRLMDPSTVVVGVTPTSTGYELALSDGTVCRVTLGEQLGTLVPLLGIDAEGYWTVSFDNGATSERLEAGGGYVSAWPRTDGSPAENASGVTPQLRVDDDGNWLVSLDGSTFELLLQDGEPVSALGRDDGTGYSSFFKSVVYNPESGKLHIELLSGISFSLAVCDTFSLTVAAAASERFFLSETRQFDVVQTNVAEALLSVPAGWTARLEETSLLVTAPPRQNSGGDTPTLRIIAVSDEGYRKVVKLDMELLDEGLYAGACTAWRNFVAGAEDNVLLDFSYAGYAHGEQAPADVMGLGYKVVDMVADYGADPTGRTSSREAFIRALTDNRLYRPDTSYPVNPNARVIFYFPEGDYVLHNADDDTKRDTPLIGDNGETVAYSSSEISIQGGRFIIKGAGRDRTNLIMDSENYPNTSDLWTSPVMINIKHNSGLSSIASVTEDAVKGAFSVEVDRTTGISAGSWVCLRLACSQQACIAEELAPHVREAGMLAANADIATIKVEEFHCVKSVSGKTVTFCEPIMHAVKAAYGWDICKYNYYEEVGIEDLSFVGRAKEQFGHHVSWRDDGGYKPLQMMRLVNSWVRRVDFRSVSEALSIVSSANCSAYDIEISGNRGHSAVRSQSSSRIFIGKVYDHSSGNILTNAGGSTQGAFMEDAGQYHASGVSNLAIGTVLWNNTWGRDALFESHSRQPRATLVDNGRGGLVQWRFGGDENNVPNHLADLTIWNMEATRVSSTSFSSAPWQWWLSSDRYWKVLPPTIVGFHGQSVTFDEDPSQLKYLESNGAAVVPESLYEAQLRNRLGYVPAWLATLKQIK